VFAVLRAPPHDLLVPNRGAEPQTRRSRRACSPAIRAPRGVIRFAPLSRGAHDTEAPVIEANHRIGEVSAESASICASDSSKHPTRLRPSNSRARAMKRIGRLLVPEVRASCGQMAQKARCRELAALAPPRLSSCAAASRVRPPVTVSAETELLAHSEMRSQVPACEGVHRRPASLM